MMLVLGGVAFLTHGALTDAKDTAKKPQQKVEDEIKIENEGYNKDRYHEITFHHRKHQDEYINADGKSIGCKECHHVYENGKNAWNDDEYVQRCVECHDPLKSDPKNKNIKKLQLAFHNNCKGCHQAVIKAGLKKEKEAPSKKCIKCMGKKK